jgi:SAM-dependent methyltransferase
MRLRRTSARWFPPCSPLVVALSDSQPGERVLDIACGTSLVARLAAQRVGRTENVIGLDLKSRYTSRDCYCTFATCRRVRDALSG